STFIASYCMLVFVARLQRFDIGLTEAALDLGATNVQAFRKIMLPFLKPAIASSAVLAFLASFENYNTTTFTFGKYPTLTIELAQKVRYGINPSISVLAFIIVVLTIVGALTHEIYQRRKQLAIANGAPVSSVGGSFQLPKFLRNNPAAILMVVLAVGGFSTIWFANVYSPDSCKVEVREHKRLLQQKRIDEIQQQRLKQKQKKAQQGPDIFDTKNSLVPKAVPVPKSPGKGAFGSVFDPQNLDKAAPGEGKTGAEAPATNPGKGAFGNIFDPQNLKKQTESDN
ncbi:MAG: ABC transporter permease subunit, partial [Rhodospirillales bacterium]|nr:ABC transporter permease subunit [Rhodospirillales bacterium]